MHIYHLAYSKVPPIFYLLFRTIRRAVSQYSSIKSMFLRIVKDFDIIAFVASGLLNEEDEDRRWFKKVEWKIDAHFLFTIIDSDSEEPPSRFLGILSPKWRIRAVKGIGAASFVHNNSHYRADHHKSEGFLSPDRARMISFRSISRRLPQWNE